MQVKSGDKARKSGDIKCMDCEGTVFIEVGEEVPNCPCGGTEFAEHREPASKHSQHAEHSKPSEHSKHSEPSKHSEHSPAKKRKPA